MIFLKDFFLVLTVIPRLIWGWVRIILRISNSLFKYFLSLGLFEKILLIVSLAQFGGTLRPWIEYSVDFLENPETVQVSVKSNLWIILLSLGVLVTSQLSTIRFQKKILIGLQILLTILVSLGFAFPSILFTDFINPLDYHYSIFAKVFVGIHYPFSLFILFYFFQKQEKTNEVSETLTSP